eukprot:CAMPEP_0183579192 /NCGR_PEP_ID=MMETSP0371-20130417/143285_1 /TAXON_ID=268820 /ORGANISM="Peridinium aciculiferum, Strain PAER-2" /LENGTH=275 /DNA_ID=CAMNT_0025789689 /DNA_START=8 /DNA_END=832 /DNA_ORIENTATION=-
MAFSGFSEPAMSPQRAQQTDNSRRVGTPTCTSPKVRSPKARKTTAPRTVSSPKAKASRDVSHKSTSPKVMPKDSSRKRAPKPKVFASGSECTGIDQGRGSSSGRGDGSSQSGSSSSSAGSTSDGFGEETDAKTRQCGLGHAEAARPQQAAPQAHEEPVHAVAGEIIHNRAEVAGSRKVPTRRAPALRRSTNRSTGCENPRDRKTWAELRPQPSTSLNEGPGKQEKEGEQEGPAIAESELEVGTSEPSDGSVGTSDEDMAALAAQLRAMPVEQKRE